MTISKFENKLECISRTCWIKKLLQLDYRLITLQKTLPNLSLPFWWFKLNFTAMELNFLSYYLYTICHIYQNKSFRQIVYFTDLISVATFIPSEMALRQYRSCFLRIKKIKYRKSRLKRMDNISFPFLVHYAVLSIYEKETIRTAHWIKVNERY